MISIMSRSYYEKVNKCYMEFTANKYRNSYIDTKTQSFKLLLDIIDSKTDDEFDTFYTKYMSKLQLKKYYYLQDYEFSLFPDEGYFKSFKNTKDFIEKSCSNCIKETMFGKDVDFYIELNKFLTDIIQINHSLKKEEDERIELMKKEEEERMKACMKDVKQTKTNNDNKINDKDKKKKKKPISVTIKRLVWNTHIGEEIGKAKCMCCKVTDITQMSFNCGHIIAEANGGETIVSNLKPICQNCNSSMGTKNMEDFMKSLK